MSFSKDRVGIYHNLIEPAIKKAGYSAVRVDQDEHNQSINDYIIGQIKGCRFLVSDFTRQSQGVYFEAGLALGLGRNVIWMCSEKDRANLHFDTRHYNHILYDDADLATGMEKLKNRILALEGPGPDFKEAL